MCEQIVTTPFHFDHLPTQGPKSLRCSQALESSKYLQILFGGLAPMDTYVKKDPKKLSFFQVRFET